MIWESLRSEALKVAEKERILAKILNEFVLERENLEDALSWRLSSRLAKGSVPENDLRDLFRKTLSDSSESMNSIESDLIAVRERDPACNNHLSPFL